MRDDDERRERYAAAIYGADRMGHDWASATYVTRDLYLRAADAVLSRVDTERARDRAVIEGYKQCIDRQQAALTALREELGEARRELDLIRDAEFRASDKVCAENGELKRKLDRARRDAAYHNQRADGILAAAVEAQDRLDASRSEIDRLREARDAAVAAQDNAPELAMLRAESVRWRDKIADVEAKHDALVADLNRERTRRRLADRMVTDVAKSHMELEETNATLSEENERLAGALERAEDSSHGLRRRLLDVAARGWEDPC